MNRRILKPSYPHKPISSLTALSKALGIDKDEIINISSIANDLYKSNIPTVKSDGSKRYTYRVEKRLKTIQKSINKNIFRKTFFPSYLQGSIRDRNNPRSAINDARLHANSIIIISEDVSNFFPSIKESHVLNIWKYFFNFPDEVAFILTKLTTLDGFVAQGAPTSSYIANLIFWDTEPKLVALIKAGGMTYSRYVDDVTISSSGKKIPKEVISNIILRLKSDFKKKGLILNKKKQKILTRNRPMAVHGLNLNTGLPTIGRKKKQIIRMDIFILSKLIESKGIEHEDTQHLYNSIKGKINSIKPCSASLAKKFTDSLEDIYQ